MDLSRRKFLLMGVGLLAAGCTSSEHLSGLAPVDWSHEPGSLGGNYPSATPHPTGTATPPLHNAVRPGTGPQQTYHPASVIARAGVEGTSRTTRTQGTPVSPESAASVSGDISGGGGGSGGGGLRAIARSQWAGAQPIASRLNPMNGVSRITVHHEGWKVVAFDDATSMAKRLESIRQYHLAHLGAGDIGYHFVVDRAGRLWQGRDSRFQGAHVLGHNEHNIGVMVLGNFDLQAPTDAQLNTLNLAVAQLMGSYRVPASRVYTHREFNPTECPGTALQPRVESMRSRSFA